MEILQQFDKFGRKLTQVNVNWDIYMVPEYKVGDLVQHKWDDKARGLIRVVEASGTLVVDWLCTPLMLRAIQDYEVELVSPVD